MTDHRIGWLSLMQLPTQPLILAVDLTQLQQPTNLAEHFIEKDRLHQVVLGAALKCLDGTFDGAISRNEQHERLGIDRQNAMQCLDAIDTGKIDVAEHDIEKAIGRPLSRLLAAA